MVGVELISRWWKSGAVTRHRGGSGDLGQSSNSRIFRSEPVRTNTLALGYRTSIGKHYCESTQYTLRN